MVFRKNGASGKALKRLYGIVTAEKTVWSGLQRNVAKPHDWKISSHVLPRLCVAAFYENGRKK